MHLVTIDEIRVAAETLRNVAVRTPLLPCSWADPDRPLWLKPENLQPVGAFKIRGAYHAIARLAPDARTGVVTYSSGNHAQAVAYAARAFGVPATIVVQDNAAPVKIEQTRALGAEVVVVPLPDRESVAHEIAERRGAVLVPPFDHPHVITGQGTVGLEIVEDLPDVDLVLVPISGGGLISGVATAVKALRPDARVVGVEPELSADARDSLAAGEIVHWSPRQRARTVAEGLQSEPSDLTFAHIRKLVDDIVTVTEDEILDAVATLALRARLVAEPSGAVTAAAYLNRTELPAGRTAAVVSGGNIDPALLAEVLRRRPAARC
ncbi:MAG TPA: threonine/serine dehydratase [Actinophytocola sp.]|uniref:threonine ammonia-lyase n=1 Tax=Actinophytocola sp. TaxID=1872138 RepID=UPI002DDD5852|nr:threonine/serine dehydratase [Actinophytocola sp.]HEV2780731.1 threonine/serine dehydratase [Actinophytocola sp.]